MNEESVTFFPLPMLLWESIISIEGKNKTYKIIGFEKNILHSILIDSVSYSQKPIYNVVAIFFL